MFADDPRWVVQSSEPICDSPYVPVALEHIITPSRPEGVSWTVAHRKQAAIVAPRTPEGHFLLIRQERAAIRRTLWEFPAGQVDQDVTYETIRATAHRELAEETGCRCDGALIALGHFFSSAGFTDECGHLFLATDVVPNESGRAPDEHEAILEVRAFTPRELGEMIAVGEIVDANTLAIYARLQAKGLI